MLINDLSYFNVYLKPTILILNQLHSSDHLQVIGRSKWIIFYTKFHDQTVWVICDITIINHS